MLVPMTAQTLAAAHDEPLSPPAAGETTERVGLLRAPEGPAERRGATELPSTPGRYLEVQGPGASWLVPLGRGVTHIGRGLSSDVRLDENSVSRRHAVIVDRPGGARILDDRSSNGTLVNGRRVAQAELRDGDVLVLGRVVLRYLEVFA